MLGACALFVLPAVAGAQTISIAAASATEGTAITFAVSIAPTTNVAVTVDYATSVAAAQTATSGTDFTAATTCTSGGAGCVTIAANAGSATFTVATTGETTVEANETFTVTLSAPTAGTLGTATATGTINNDDADISIANASATEGIAITFTVSVSGTVNGATLPTAVTVDYATSVGATQTATSGTDFTAATTCTSGGAGCVTIAANTASTTFTVATTGETTVEANETFTVTLSAPTGGYALGTATATGTINNDDADISIADASATEGIAITFTVSVSGTVNGATLPTAVTVDYATSVGATQTATSGTDFTAATTCTSGGAGCVTIAANTASTTFTVATAGDTTVEANETFTVTLSAPTGGYALGTSAADGTIVNDDSATVSIAAPAAVSDPSGSGTTLAAVDFTVTLSNPVATGAVSVAWSVGTSTATSGSDYTALTPGTLTFPAGSTTAQTIAVTVLDDDVVEASESLVLGIAASGTLPADVSVSATNAEATLTIDDEDEATVSIAAPAAVSDPSGSGATLTAVDFTVTLSNPVATGAVSVAWSVGTSTATSGSDYTALTPGTLTFPAGSTTAQTIAVTVLDDDVVEASESLVLGIAASGTLPLRVSVSATNAEATLTIDDEDEATVSIAAPAAVTDPLGIGVSIAAVNFTVTLSNPVATGAVSVAWSVGTSTATSGSDYTALTPGTLTFPAGSTTAQTIAVTVLDDDVVEASESLVLGIAASGTLPLRVSVSATNTEATLTIDDEDEATVSIAAPGAVTDPLGSGVSIAAVNFTVTLSNPVATGAVSVAWSVGTSTATSGSDYTALTPGTLTFPAGSTTAQTIAVTVLDDDVVEASESLVLGIAASGTLPADVSVSATNAEATLTIDDEDEATVSIAAPAAVSDPSGSGVSIAAVNFTVTLSNPVATGAVSVAWSVGTSTATSGSDYTALTPGTLTFPAGSTTAQTIAVTVLDDDVVEASESLVLGIAASGTLPADVSVSATNAEATLTIDDEDEATVSIAAPAAVSDPSGSGVSIAAVNFTVTLSNPVATGAVSVAWSVGTSTATSGSDYTALTPGTLTFPAGSTTAQTIAVTVLDDDVVEASESLVLGIAASGTLPLGVSVSATNAEATLTINDEDAATVSIAAPGAVTDPLGSGVSIAAVNFTVTLSNPVATGAVSVAWSVGTSTATSGSDYTALTPGTLTFPAGSTTAQTIAVTVLDDDVVEASESLVLGIAASGTLPLRVSVSATNTEATLTIDDEDEATVSIAAPGAVTDPLGSGVSIAAVNFTVTLSNPVATGAVSVAWSVGTSTATSGSDYTALTPGTLTFPAGSTTAQTIAVTVLDDDVVEASESLVLGIAASGTLPADVSVSATNAEATLTIDDEDEATVSIAAPAAVTDPSGSGATLTAVDFTVTLSNPVATGAVSVAWSVGTSTATSGSDYTALTPGTLTFPAGSTTAQTIAVTVLDDDVVEASESLVLGIAASGTLPLRVSVSATNAEATLTIDDEDEATVSIAAPAAVTDPLGIGVSIAAVNFTVTLSNPVATGAVSVAWSVGTSTATSGSDYTALTPGTLTFPAGSTTAQTIAVTVLDDDVVEASESLVLGIAASGTLPLRVSVSATNAEATLTIDDEDEATVSIAAPGAVTDPLGSGVSIAAVNFTVTLSNPVATGAVSVAWSVGTSTATSGSDYTALTPGTLTFPAGSTTAQTIAVTVLDDDVVEASESLVLGIAASGTLPLRVSVSATNAEATLTIDDEDEATVSIAAPAAVTDPLGSGVSIAAVNFTVTLSNPVATGAVSVAWSVGTSTATSGSDYTALTPGTLTFPAGSTTAQTIAVTVLDDDVVEASESLVLGIAASGTLPLGVSVSATNAEATLTIDDEDEATVSIAAPAAVTDPLGSGVSIAAVNFTVTLSNPVATGAVSVAWSVGTSTATSGSDYTALTPGTLTFPAGSTTAQTIAVTVLDDDVVEASESLVLGIAASGTLPLGVSVSATNAEATLTINDEDEATVSIAAPAAVTDPLGSGVSIAAVNFTVTLSNPVATGAVSVAWSVGTSTATSGSDYTALTPGTLTFPAGSTTAQTIAVTVLDDDVVEASESLVLGIAASGTLPLGVSVSATNAEATLTINDEDEATVSIAAPGAVTDPLGSGVSIAAVNFTVTLSNPVATGAVSVAWSVGTSTATSGSDYTALTPGTLTFPAGSTTAQTIAVTVLDDDVVEASESLVLGIAASGTLPLRVSVSATNAEATLTINDEDAATVSIAAPAAVTDPLGSGVSIAAVNFTVTLSNPVATGAVSVAWSVGTSTATSGSDYTALTPGTLTFPAGSTTAQTIAVTVLDDDVVEASESLVLGIAASGTLPLGVSVSATNAEATLTIDDEDEATVSIAAPAAVTDPLGSGVSIAAVNFTVTLSNPVATGAVSVAWSVGTSTATSGSDYTALTPGTLTFPAGSTTAQTIAVTVLDDDVVEASESLVLGIAASGTLPLRVSVSATNTEATLTIDDEDEATVSIAAPGAVTDPLGSGVSIAAVNFTVTLSNPVATGAVSVAWSVGTSTATSGSDYTALTPGTLTFPAGSTTAQTIAVTVLDDDVVEASESLVLGIAASGTLPLGVSVSATNAEATLTINDEDAATVSIAAPGAVTDPLGSGVSIAAVNFTVTLSNPVATGAVSVAWSVGTSTATSGSDYTALTPGTLTFPAGSTTAQTIAVTVLDDDVVEASESLVLGIAASGTLPLRVSVSATNAEATLTINDEDAATVSIAAPAAVTDPLGSGVSIAAVNFTVTLSNPVATGAVSVAWSVGTSTATSGSDYTALTPGTLTFPAGSTTAQTIAVTVLDDDVVEASESLVLGIAASGTLPLGVSVSATNAEATLTINDEDEATVSIAAPAAVTDPLGSGVSIAAVNFTVTLSNPVATGAVSVAWSVGTSTATSGSDYTALTPGTLTFPAGSTTAQTIAVTVLDDDVVEASESLVLGIAASGTLPLRVSVSATNAEATLTIDDEDEATVSIAAPGAVTDPSGSGVPIGAVDFTVTLSNPVATGAVSVAWSVGTSTATSGSDYTALTPGTLTFPAGSTTAQTISVTVLDDDVVEAPESLVLGIAASGTLPLRVSVSATNAEATLTINDADAATVSIAAPGAVTDPSGSGVLIAAVDFTVTLSNPVATGAVSVAWSVGTSTATSGSDYTALTPGTLTFPAGSTTAQTISVTVLDDNVVEETETLMLGIAESGTFPAGVAVVTAEATLAINDADGAPDIMLRVDPVEVAESDGPTELAVTATFSGSAATFADATVVTVAVTGSDVVAAVDFEPVSGFKLTIAGGATSGTATFTLIPEDDDLDELNETITVAGTATALTGPLMVHSTQITLMDDDAANVDAGVDRTTVEGAEVTLSGAESIYAEGSQPTFAWAQIAGPEVELSDPAAVMTRFTAPSGLTETTDLTFALTVTDESDPELDESDLEPKKATDTVTITVVVGLPVIDPTESDEIATVEIAEVVVAGDLDPADQGAVSEPPPAGASFASDDRRILNITPMDAQGNPVEQLRKPVELCLIVDAAMREAFEAFINEAFLLDRLTLLHYDDNAGAWEELPGAVVTRLDGIDRVCAPVDKFSPFAVGGKSDPGVTLSTTELEIVEGEQATYTVTAEVRPEGGDVTLVAEVEGDANVAIVADGGEPARAIVLTFTSENWKQPRQITVRVSEDPDPDDETASIRHQIGGAQYDDVEVPDVEIAVTDLMTVSRASATRDWLVRFGRTVATTTVDAISARVTDTPVVADGSITLAGRPVQFDATPQPMALDHPRLGLPSDETGQVLSFEELIAGSAFTLSRLTGAGGGIVDGTGGWGIWGAGAYGQFTGQSPEGYSVNGEVVSAFVGMDRAVARRLIGVAVSFNSGSGGYDDVDMGAGATGAGEILASLYSVHPYFRLELAEGLDVWGTVGAGVGNMQIDDDGGTFETEIRMAMGAAGSRYELILTEGLDLALKTDALFAAMYAAATPGLPALKPYTTRLRLGLETSYDLLLGAGLRLAPSVEAGVRYDGGAAETGAGFDLGGGLQLVAPAIGMTIEGRGRMLLANWTDVGAVQWTIRDWGAAGLLQWAPGADGLGLTLSLAPSWGGAADVAPALWEQGALLAAAPGGAPNPAGRLAAEVGYGLAAFGRTSVLTPYGGVALAEAGARSYRAGIRFAVGQTVDLNLEGIRRQPASGTAEDVLHMQGQFRF